MKIPNQKKQSWKSLRQQGDITRIHEANKKISRNAIAGALEGNECSIEVFEAVEKYYIKRQAKVDALIK